MSTDIWLLLKQEFVLAAVVVVLLFIKVGASDWRQENILALVNGLLLANLLAGLFVHDAGGAAGLAGGLGSVFHTNPLIIFEKNLLNLGTLLLSMQAYPWLKNHKHTIEFYVLLLSALLGMFFMISAGNLLLFYIGLELSTIPLAALSNFDLEKRQSSEAAMKFILSSAFSSGLLLLGISFVYGTAGTLDYAGIAAHLDGSALQLFAFILLLSGFAFKISVVPFHLWTADVYEGSPVPVTAYLSVISKGSIFFVLVPVLYTVFRPMSDNWALILYLLAGLTMITGNLFAVRQNKLKRLLAFSSISQVGFIVLGISAGSRIGGTSMVYFIVVYLFSNLGAFGVVSLISALTGKESIEDYRGLYKTNPFLCWVMAICLFSLAGIPPTAGFFGKFFLLIAGAGTGFYALIIFAALNMIVSLYYYLRVIKAMFMDANESPIQVLRIPLLASLSLAVCVAGTLTVGVWGWIYDYIYSLSIYF
jgi:NADH-quinone oxidoreductase subunit N